MSAPIYLTTICLFLGAIVLVFAMRYTSSMMGARARVDGDNAYRLLAEQAASTQAQNQETLSALQAELAKLSASLAAVEKILKQVG